jgi:hypothetical protein
MSSLNEVKYAGLLLAVGGTGTIDELESRWLELQGFGVGGINERWCAWLGSLGHTGTIEERQIKYWIAEGGVGKDWNELAHWFWSPHV